MLTALHDTVTYSLHVCFCCLLLFFVFAPASQRDAGRSEEKIKGIKVKYERQLSELKSELKTLKSARKEHAKAMKKNVSSLTSIHNSNF